MNRRKFQTLLKLPETCLQDIVRHVSFNGGIMNLAATSKKILKISGNVIKASKDPICLGLQNLSYNARVNILLIAGYMISSTES